MAQKTTDRATDPGPSPVACEARPQIRQKEFTSKCVFTVVFGAPKGVLREGCPEGTGEV